MHQPVHSFELLFCHGQHVAKNHIKKSPLDSHARPVHSPTVAIHVVDLLPQRDSHKECLASQSAVLCVSPQG